MHSFLFIGLIPAANSSELETICNGSNNCRAAIVFPDKLEALKTSPAEKGAGATINYEIRMKNFTMNYLLPKQTLKKCNEHWEIVNDFAIVGPNKSTGIENIFCLQKYINKCS